MVEKKNHQNECVKRLGDALATLSAPQQYDQIVLACEALKDVISCLSKNKMQSRDLDVAVSDALYLLRFAESLLSSSEDARNDLEFLQAASEGLTGAARELIEAYESVSRAEDKQAGPA